MTDPARGVPSKRYRDHLNPPAPRERAPQYVADSELGPAMAALNDRQRAFVLAKTLNGASNADAAKLAGYAGDSDTLKTTGYRLAHDPRVQAALQEEAVKLMRDHAPVMIEVLHSIAINPQNDPKARIKAASELLSRSGLGSISEHKITVERTDRTRDPQTVAAEIIAMGRQMGLELDPKHLLGPPPVDAEFEEVDDLSDIL